MHLLEADVLELARALKIPPPVACNREDDESSDVRQRDFSQRELKALEAAALPVPS
jgi:hypothetical protein